MSCWVVPTVAAEYWGVTLDVVWCRIYDGLVPHKTDEGFVFIDLDPWTADSQGVFPHEPPLTFVTAGEEFEPLDYAHFDSNNTFSSPAQAWPPAVETEDFAAESDTVDDADAFVENVEVFEAESEALDERVSDDDLPDLDEEEAATFGRLSWQEVRSQVSRTRRPPPVRA
jgi:hypothetical protein